MHSGASNPTYDNWYTEKEESSPVNGRKERVTLKPGQVERLLHEMELRPDLVAGKVDGYTGRKDFQRQWTEIAAIVSALPGPKFTGIEIKKRWSQLKYRMKARTAEIEAHSVDVQGGEGREEKEVGYCGPKPLTQLEERVLLISQGSYANGIKSYVGWDGGIHQGDDGATSDHAITSDLPQQLEPVSIKQEPYCEESLDRSSFSSDHEGENDECLPKKKRKRRESDENGNVGIQDVVELQQGIFSRIEALESTLKEVSSSISTAIRDSSERHSEHLREQNRLLNCLLVGLCPQFQSHPPSSS